MPGAQPAQALINRQARTRNVIDEVKAEAEKKMKKSLEALGSAFNKIRTGRAHPAILDSVMVNYYGQETPLKQVASVNVEDNRTLLVAPWEKNLVQIGRASCRERV